MKAADADGEDVMGRPLTYVEQVEKRIKKNPTDVANFTELAQYFYQQGDYEQSEKYYAGAVKLTKDSPDMFERLLDAQKQKFAAKIISLPEDSKKFKAEALELKAKFEKQKTAEIRDEFYKVKEKYERAKKELETIQQDFDQKNIELARHRIKYHPAHAGYHFEYAELLQKTGEIKEAIAEFQLAKADVTRKGDCLFTLGQCFEHIKQYKLAMTHYQEAIEELSDTAENKKEALYLAAKLAIELQDNATAEKYGHQLAAIDFSYKDVGELLDKVTQTGNN
jgi:tetratricopeptide (TPR) repeat protein